MQHSGTCDLLMIINSVLGKQLKMRVRLFDICLFRYQMNRATRWQQDKVDRYLKTTIYRDAEILSEQSIH